jgi:hypothetical protein
LNQHEESLNYVLLPQIPPGADRKKLNINMHLPVAPADVIRGFMNILDGDKRVILSLN